MINSSFHSEYITRHETCLQAYHTSKIHFSATALVLLLPLVTAVPCHQTHQDNMLAKGLSGNRECLYFQKLYLFQLLVEAAFTWTTPQRIEAYIYTSERLELGINK